MKKLLTCVLLLGLAEFALAGETKNIIFDKEFEFDIDEYANKPCGKDWSEIEKKMCNLDRNSYMKTTHVEVLQWYEIFKKECIENSDKNACERSKIISAKIKNLGAKIVDECHTDRSENACYDAGLMMINNVHILRDDEAAIKSFEFACDTLKSAKNCEQAGFLYFHKDEAKAKIFFDKACDLNKNYCMGEVILQNDLENLKEKCNKNNFIACVNYFGVASSMALENKLKPDEEQFEKSVDKLCELAPNFDFERAMAMFTNLNDFLKFKYGLYGFCNMPLDVPLMENSEEKK